MKRIGIYALMSAALVWSCNKSETISGGEGDDWEYDKVTVLEYSPAPGQFINENYVPGNAAQASKWAQERISDTLFVSLGAFGGYIVVKPSRAVTNGEGYDFGIAGNPISTHNEPGVVWVSRDDNGNGAPDDTWYQLKGSDTGRYGYTVTYFRTDEPGEVSWEDSDGETGSVAHLSTFHSQNYYPAWCDVDGSITLTGTLLSPRYELVNSQHTNKAYGWGYADNLGSDAAYNEKGRYMFNRFDLSNAIDGSGNPVSLDRIDFIKVQSALLFNMASTGELSTEVTGFILIN